jgi:hypothetical protein
MSLPGKYSLRLQDSANIPHISSNSWVHVVDFPNVVSSNWIVPIGKPTSIPVSSTLLAVPNAGCFMLSQSISHPVEVVGKTPFCSIFSNISGNFTVYASVMDIVTSKILGVAIFSEPIRIISIVLTSLNEKLGCGTYKVHYYPSIPHGQVKLCSKDTMRCVSGISPNDFVFCPVLGQNEVFLLNDFVQSNFYPIENVQTKRFTVSIKPTIHYLGAATIITVNGLFEIDSKSKCCVRSDCQSLTLVDAFSYICNPSMMSSLDIGLNYVTIIAWESISDFEVILKKQPVFEIFPSRVSMSSGAIITITATESFNVKFCMVQSESSNAISIGNGTYLCRARFDNVMSSIFFSEDGRFFSFSRPVLSIFNQARLLVDPEVCIVAESCSVIFSGNFSGSPLLESNPYAVDNCKRVSQGLECTFVFNYIGSAIINILDDFSKLPTQIIVSPRINAQFWPSSVLDSERLYIFVSVLDFSHSHLFSKIANDIVECSRVGDSNLSHVFKCDFRFFTGIVSESYSLFVGLSPRAFQNIGRIQVLGKPLISAVFPSRVKAFHPQTISVVGHNFDSSLNVSCLASGHLTIASILNSKILICSKMVFSPGNVTIGIKYNDLVFETFTVTAAAAARVLEAKALNVRGKFLRVILHVDAEMSSSNLHAKINGNYMTCFSANFSVTCDYHQYFVEQHYSQFLMTFEEQDIIGEILIERVQPINVVENIIPSSILLSSKESLVTLVGSFPTSVGYVSIGQEVMSYQSLSNTTAMLVIRPYFASLTALLQSTDTLLLKDTLHFFCTINVLSVWPRTFFSGRPVDLFLYVEEMDRIIHNFECVIEEERFPALKLNQSHVHCQVYVKSSFNARVRLAVRDSIVASNMLIVDVLETNVTKLLARANCETSSTYCFQGNQAVLGAASCVIFDSYYPLNSSFCCSFQVLFCTSTVLSLKYHDVVFFESREIFLPSVQIKISPSIASNAGHHVVTLFGNKFELFPAISIANIPVSCALAPIIVCNIPRSTIAGLTYFYVSSLNLSLPFVYTPSLVVDGYKIEGSLLIVNGQFESCTSAELVIGNMDIVGTLLDNVMTFASTLLNQGNISAHIECNHKTFASASIFI